MIEIITFIFGAVIIAVGLGIGLLFLAVVGLPLIAAFTYKPKPRTLEHRMSRYYDYDEDR